MRIDSKDITAVILAGGQGTRLGGKDKGLIELNNKPLVELLVPRLQPQVADILISANRNIPRYTEFGYPVLSDEVSDFAGPLAGILTALQQMSTKWLLTVPADSPFIPLNLASLLADDIGESKVVMVHDGERLQPTFALLHHSLADSLQQFLASGERKTRQWMQQQPHKTADFSQQKQAFMNINTEEDLKMAEKHFTTFMA